MTLRAGVEVVSHTELSTFRRCSREYWYAYQLGRVPLVKSKALEVGSRIDHAIKAHYDGGGMDLAGLETSERALMLAYARYWGTPDRLFKCDRAGVKFQVLAGTTIVKGEFDAVGTRHDTGAQVLLEVKTTSEDISPGSPYWRRIAATDPQPLVYLAAAKAMGWKASQVLWDVMRKPILRRKVKESAEDFELRILEDILARPGFYFQRQTIVRFEADHESYVKDVAGTVRLMQVVREMGPNAPKNPDACTTRWGSLCRYFDVCEGAADIHDDRLFGPHYRQSEREQPKMTTSFANQFEF